jgi:hypothetical protein
VACAVGGEFQIFGAGHMLRDAARQAESGFVHEMEVLRPACREGSPRPPPGVRGREPWVGASSVRELAPVE